MAANRTYQVNGQVYTAAPNTLRVESINGWPYSAALIEPPSTNVSYPSTPTSAGWQSNSNAGAPTLTYNAAVAPDGTTTALEVANVAVSGGLYSFVNQLTEWTATASSWTASVWLKGAVGGEIVYITLENATPTYISTKCTLTTSWHRYTVTGTLSAIASYVAIGTDLRDINQAATPAQTFYVWGAQAENMVGATSLIPTTTAAASANGDLIGVPSYLVSPSQGSLSMDIQLNPGFTAQPGGLFSSGGTNPIQILWSTGFEIGIFSKGIGVYAWTPDLNWHHVGLSWQASGTNTDFTFYFDRVTVVAFPVAYLLQPGDFAAQMNVGWSLNAQYFENWTGHIANVKMSTDPQAGL